jgi:hypothetical protein
MYLSEICRAEDRRFVLVASFVCMCARECIELFMRKKSMFDINVMQRSVLNWYGPQLNSSRGL